MLLQLRRSAIEVYVHLHTRDFGLLLPKDTADISFLFFPSDVQYCGPTGPYDLRYDANVDPVADDAVMDGLVYLPVVWGANDSSPVAPVGSAVSATGRARSGGPGTL